MDEKEKDSPVGYIADEVEVDKESEQSKASHPEHETAGRKKAHHKKPHHKLHDLEEIMKKTVKERDEFQDKYLRALAEMDNFRKRVLKEKEEFQKYVLGDILLDLLQILDNLDRALKAKNAENDKAIISGVEITRKQFVDLLKKYNVTEIDTLGKRFDPSLHEALSKEERPGISEPVVIEVYQKGFVYRDKLLRPALTKVAVPLQNPETAKSE